MFLRESIVLLLSLLSGFSDALIFVFTESFAEFEGMAVNGPVSCMLIRSPMRRLIFWAFCDGFMVELHFERG